MKKKYYIAGGVVLVLAMLTTLQFVNKRKDLMENSQVIIEKLKSDYLTFESTVVAKAECNDKAEIYAPEAFYVENVLVKENDIVKKGDRLFHFRTQAYVEEITKEEENKRMISEQIAQEKQQEKSRLSELKLSLSTYQLTCNLAKNDLDYQKKCLLQARRDYKKDKDNLVLLAAEKAFDDAKEKYKSALEQCKYIKEEITDYQNCENPNIKILQQKIKLSELSIMQLKEKKQIIENMQYADKSGMVTELGISKGIYTIANQKVYTLYNVDKLNLKIKTEEKTFDLLSEGDSVTLNDGQINFSLAVKEKQATSQDKTSEVVLNDTFYLITPLDKEQKKEFKIGETRQCTMTFSNRTKSLLCSYSSLIHEGDSYFVFICDLDTQKIRKQKVQIGNLQENKIEISGDITEQDYIVKNPDESYRDGEVFASVVKR